MVLRALLGLDKDSESDQDINNAIGVGKSKYQRNGNLNLKNGEIKIMGNSGYGL